MNSFCSAKANHIFSAKNIRILYIESAKTVNEMTLNELVKLTTLWTTGPWWGSPATFSSPVGHASNWAIKAGLIQLWNEWMLNGEQVYSHSPSYPKDSVWPAWANSVAQIKQAHLDLHYLPFSQHFVLLFSFNCETNESLTSVLLNPDIPSFANSVDLKKPTDLDLHCLPLSMWIYNNNLDQVIWLAEN